jgi:hypothetical protein
MPSSGMLLLVALVIIIRRTYYLHQGDSNRRARNTVRNVLRLIVTVNVVPVSPILVTLMTETLHSSVTSAATRVTRRHIPEDGILHYFNRCRRFPE